MSTITFSGAAIRAITAHALGDYPHECCGALLGTEHPDGRRVAISLPIANVSGEDRRRRFSVAPRDYIRAEREADARGLRLLGFYHSHPDHPARPSETDRTFAQPGFSYPIVSVGADGVGEIRSWRLDDGAPWYQEEEVVITEDTTP